MGKDVKNLRVSNIQIDNAYDFGQDLKEVYKDNVKYRGKEIQDRGELLRSFGSYLLQSGGKGCLKSLGDVLRFKVQGQGYVGLNAFDNFEYGLPVLLGLRDSGDPYIVDLEDNTSGVIIGGSRSGKTWLAAEMMLNLSVTNSYNTLQFLVLDGKDTSIWNEFARFPHVLGYHTDIYNYVNVLREVVEEMKRRQELLIELGIEDFSGYRKMLRENKEYEKLKEIPILFVVFDEITSTLMEIKERDEEMYNTLVCLLEWIVAEGRNFGVRLLCIGQHMNYTAIPKSVIENSTFKFGMRMTKEDDYITLFGDNVRGYDYPKTAGEGIFVVRGDSDLNRVRTLALGGKDDLQMLGLIRVVALEWLRRSKGRDNVRDLPEGLGFNKAYNRDIFYDDSMFLLKGENTLDKIFKGLSF